MGWISRLRGLFGRDRLSEDMEEELRIHLAMREEWNAAQGMEREEARRYARLRFGNPVAWRERMREIEPRALLDSLLQDLRYGARQLVKNLGFTGVAIAALALGIGLNTSVFTAYKALLFRGFDARDARRMVNVTMIRQSGAADPAFSYPDYEIYRDHLHSLSGVIAVKSQLEELTLTDVGDTESERAAHGQSLFEKWGLLPGSAVGSKAELASVMMVSENYFSVLGVAAMRGRPFAAEDTAELEKSPAVLISENYWQRRFGGDPSMLGRAIRLNGAAFTIIGITPHDFVGTEVGAPDFWFPMGLTGLVHPGDDALHNREEQCCRIFGRLAPGASMQEAQAEMNLLAEHLRSLHDPKQELSKPARLELTPGSPFPNKFPPSLRFAILLIMTAAGMVLVIACANVAGLQLARATARQNELGMRLSLGASRGRLIRQLLTESALLSLLAGDLSFISSWVILMGLARMAEDIVPPDMGTFVVHLRPDLEIFAYVLGISLLAGVLFGLAPALESSRSALAAAFKANLAHSPARGKRIRDVLVGAQVAVSLVLLIGGSMLVRSSLRALKMDTGYDDKHGMSLTLRFPDGPDYSPERREALAQTAARRIAALPGVAAVTFGRAPDTDNIRGAAVSLDGQQPTPRNTRGYVYYTYVQPNYFETVGIPLLFGQGLRQQAGQTEPNVIVSESAARQLWPGQNPIGRRLRMGTDRFGWHPTGEIVPDGPVYEVIGVARETRGVLLDGSDSDQVYVPLPQGHAHDFSLLIRTRNDPGAVRSATRPLIAGIDGNLVASTATLEEMLHETSAFLASSVCAAIALTIGMFGLVLAAMGIYSTVSYAVATRTREVGIRIALGASKIDILRLMLREGTRPVAVGLLVGLVLAVGDSYLLRGVLYGLGAIDGVSFAGVALLFAAIALIATYVPSRRAMRVDPAVTLRYE
jgi:predicted permease